MTVVVAMGASKSVDSRLKNLLNVKMLCKSMPVVVLIKYKMFKALFQCTYDRERAVGWLEAGQSVTRMVVAMGASKSVISRLKKSLKVEMLCKSMPVVLKGLSRLKMIDIYPL